MGADLISLTVVIDQRKAEGCTLEKISEWLAVDANVRKVIESTPAMKDELEYAEEWFDFDGDKEEEARLEIEVARRILLDGADSFLNGFRTHNGIPMGDDMMLLVGGGLSWGDDPYEGFSQECVFADAACDIPELHEITGAVGPPQLNILLPYLKENRP